MTKRKEPFNIVKELTMSYDFRVRFSETDPLGIVWHGNYIKYFEDGREAFGRQHGISYLDVKAAGFVTPIVKTVCEHKLPLSYGETATVVTEFVNSRAAKLIFHFSIYNTKGQLVCYGETTQVFVNSEGDLSLIYPTFFKNWRAKMGL